MKHHRVYEMLKRFGHESFKAAEIVLDARRGDRWALDWIRMVRYFS
jgi:hypothetical protein